jgi:hypothetical protein
MTFAAPGALWGLLLLAGPVLVHLLSRRQATRRPFPTLRFIDAARLQPVSRRTLDDRVLLLLRLCIIAVAVLAWARPMWTPASRTEVPAAAHALVVLVDTSASMQRASQVGPSAVVEARRMADSAAATAVRVLRVETAEPALAMSASAAWLQQAGGGDVLLLTDAQRGSIARADVAALPSTVRLVVRAVSLRDTVLAVPASPSVAPSLEVRPVQRLRELAAAFRDTTSAPVEPRLVLALATLAAHPLLRELLVRSPIDETRLPSATDSTTGWIAIPAAPHEGAPMLGWVRPATPVVLQLAIDETHPVAAALPVLLREAIADAFATPLREHDGATLDSAARAAVEQAAALGAATTDNRVMPARDDAGTSARWLWVVVLLALAAEWWLRTRMARARVHA